MFRLPVVHNWTSALVLAFGMGAIWGIAAVLVSSIVGAFLPKEPINYENIVITLDGTPLIETRLAGSYQNTEHRTLDGKAIVLSSWNQLRAGYLSKPYKESGVVELPISWKERIVGFNDAQKRMVSWILVRDAKRPGHAYFTGYDLATNYCVGYLGRQGFSPSLPPQKEWFRIGNKVFTWGDTLVTTGGHQEVGGPSRYNSGISSAEQRFKPWIVFLPDADSVLEVDLLNRSIRTVARIANACAIDTISLLAPEQDIKRSDRKYFERLLVRSDDRIVLLNTFENTEKEFVIPKHLQGKMLIVHMPNADELILQAHEGEWERGKVTELYWTNAAGEISRKETVQLVGYTENPRLITWGLGGIVPSLLPWLVVTLIVAPSAMLQEHKVESYLAGLSETFSQCWPVFLTLVVLAAVLTWWVYREQQKYSRDFTLIWCVTVFFGTLPSLFAYWLVHRKDVLGTCAECGEQVPRDRNACARCEQPFAEPRLLGTEVFA